MYSFPYDKFLISNYGNAIKIINNKEYKCKNVYDKSKGYIVINISLLDNYNNKVHKNLLVHRLVALAFIKNNNNFNIINHIDGNKCNNYYKNLEWCTTKLNMIHASKTGLCHPIYGENHYLSKLSKDLVVEIYKLYQNGYSTNEIHKLITLKNINISKSTLKQIKHKRSWKHVLNKMC